MLSGNNTVLNEESARMPYANSRFGIAKEICWLVCCPPCPSSIASKLAFVPPKPSYKFSTHDDKTVIEFTDESLWISRSDEQCNSPSYLDAFTTVTKRGNTIACLHVKCTVEPKYTILYSHGNAVDLGQMANFFYSLGCKIGCNLFSYDYSGYGISTGSPSEKNIYADVEAVWNALRQRYGIAPSKIIVYGQSIGTAPTVDLASQYDVAAVILHSPLLSGLRVACQPRHSTNRLLACLDPFNNLKKASKVSNIVLIIHGTEDEVIDFAHGVSLHEAFPRAVEPLWIEGAGHNDIELYEQYYDRLQHFVAVEIAEEASKYLATSNNIEVNHTASGLESKSSPNVH